MGFTGRRRSHVPEGQPCWRGADTGAMTPEADIAGLIERYVGELTAAGAIRSAEVERAFLTVPRHRLLETFYYRDETGFTTIDHDPEDPRREDLELIYAASA